MIPESQLTSNRKHSSVPCLSFEAIFGWRGGTMASLYTREADRRRLALGAMHKLDGNAAGANDLATSMPSPHSKVRAPAAKD
jgi:hypothetical protein